MLARSLSMICKRQQVYGGTRGGNKYMVAPVVATSIWWHPWWQQVLAAPVVATSIWCHPWWQQLYGGTRGVNKYWWHPWWQQVLVAPVVVTSIGGTRIIMALENGPPMAIIKHCVASLRQRVSLTVGRSVSPSFHS